MLRSKKTTVPKPKEISARGPRKRRNGRPKRLEAQQKHQEGKREAQKLVRKEERKGKEDHIRGLKKKAKSGSSETTKRLGSS